MSAFEGCKSWKHVFAALAVGRNHLNTSVSQSTTVPSVETARERTMRLTADETASRRARSERLKAITAELCEHGAMYRAGLLRQIDERSEK